MPDKLIEYILLAGGSCYKFMSNYEGDVRSPDYPSLYSDNLACSWSIQVQHGAKVQLRFIDMDIEGNNGCPYDALMVKVIIF